MQEPEAGGARVFRARRGLSGTWLSIFSSLIPAAVGLSLLSIGESVGAWILGVSPALGCAVVLQALHPGWHYTVGPEGIVVRRLLRVHLIRRAEIASVEPIDGTRVAELLAGRRRETLRIAAFTSAPVNLRHVRTGDSAEPRELGVMAAGRFVLVTVEGAPRLLSPVDVDGFVRAWQARAR